MFQETDHKASFSLSLIILALIGTFAGVYLSQKSEDIRQKAADTTTTTCIVSDTVTLKNCFTQAATDESLEQIEITQQIVCATKEDCMVTLSQRTKPLLIYGKPNTNAGFKRIQNYDYVLLTIGGDTTQVSNITIKDLIFDETTTPCDFIKLGSATCNTPLLLGRKIFNTIVDHVTILHAKNMGIEVAEATYLTIKNSIVYDAEGDGIWFDSAHPAAGCQVNFDNYTVCAIDETKVNRYITLENNLLVDNHISGIEFYGYGDAQNPSKITGNLFIHNHRDSKYTVCPPPKGHCPGGQLSIARSQWVVVEDNVIRDGFIDTIDPEKGVTYDSQGLKAGGIELSDSIQNILIKNNKIYNNKGAGIFADYTGAQHKVAGINILWNIFYGNGGNIVAAGIPHLETSGTYGFSFSNNIFNNPNYTSAYQKAFIFADPPICTPLPNQSTCQSTLRWYSNDYPTLSVVATNTKSTISQKPNGQLVIPSISETGETFHLQVPALDTPLASTFVEMQNKK